MLTSKEIIATLYKYVFDMTSKLLFLYILLIILANFVNVSNKSHIAPLIVVRAESVSLFAQFSFHFSLTAEKTFSRSSGQQLPQAPNMVCQYSDITDHRYEA